MKQSIEKLMYLLLCVLSLGIAGACSSSDDDEESGEEGSSSQNAQSLIGGWSLYEQGELTVNERLTYNCLLFSDGVAIDRIDWDWYDNVAQWKVSYDKSQWNSNSKGSSLTIGSKDYTVSTDSRLSSNQRTWATTSRSFTATPLTAKEYAFQLLHLWKWKDTQSGRVHDYSGDKFQRNASQRSDDGTEGARSIRIEYYEFTIYHPYSYNDMYILTDKGSTLLPVR